MNSAFSNNMIPIHSKNLCIPHCLNFISKKKNECINWKLNSGISIATTSMKYYEGKEDISYKNYKKSIPLIITIPNYNSIEFLSVMTHYMNNNIITKYLNYSDFLGYRMLTGKIMFVTD